MIKSYVPKGIGMEAVAASINDYPRILLGVDENHKRLNKPSQARDSITKPFE
jgi:hypothetical protein